MIFSRLLALPFAIATGIVAYIAFIQNVDGVGVWIIPLIIILTIILVFQHQINVWWWTRNPPNLDAQLFSMIYQSFPILFELSPEKKELFQLRLSIYLKSNDFTEPGMKEVPLDVHASILAPAVFLSLDQENLWYDDYQRIVMYKHPFLSPRHSEKMHTAELHAEDGLFIFSIEQLLPGLLHPKEIFNLSTYIVSQAYILKHDVPQLEESQMVELGKRPFSYYTDILGLDDLDLGAMSLHHSMIHYEKLDKNGPVWRFLLSKIS